MDWNEIWMLLIKYILLPLVTAGIGYLVVLIDAKKKEIQAKTDNELHQKYVGMLDKTITDCIKATNQTFVEALKTAGTFDEAAQKEAFKRTYEAIMDVLTEDAQEYLNEAIKDLNSYITTKIESGVVEAKK